VLIERLVAFIAVVNAAPANAASRLRFLRSRELNLLACAAAGAAMGGLAELGIWNWTQSDTAEATGRWSINGGTARFTTDGAQRRLRAHEDSVFSAVGRRWDLRESA